MKRVEACASVTINQECSEICTWRCLFLPRDLISLFLRRAKGSTSLLTHPVEKFRRTGTSCVAQTAICQCLHLRRCCSNTKLIWRLLVAPFLSCSCCFLLSVMHGQAAKRHMLCNSNVRHRPKVGYKMQAVLPLAACCGFECLQQRRLALFVGKHASLPTTNRKRLKNRLFAETPTRLENQRHQAVLVSFNWNVQIASVLLLHFEFCGHKMALLLKQTNKPRFCSLFKEKRATFSTCGWLWTFKHFPAE